MTADVDGLQLARLRQGLYRFFATAFLPPEEVRFGQLDPAARMLEAHGVDALAFSEPWAKMHSCLSDVCSLVEVEAEYVRLFESGIEGAPCPPVESFYVSSPRHGGPAVVSAELEAIYQRFDMTMATGTRFDVEHISPQLELMAMLCAREATATDDGDVELIFTWIDEQREFTDHHLSVWVPQFADRVQGAARSNLYRSFAIAVSAFIDHDRDLLHMFGRLDPSGSSA